jgi:hypothetical protein
LVGKMIKKTIVLTIILGLMVSALGPAQAQTEIVVPEDSAGAVFPDYIEFNLSIEGEVNITDVRLHYVVDQESFALVTSEVNIDLIPDTSVTASWIWDMRKTGGLPSGTVVEYWWTITDASGNSYKTTSQQISFDDNRYSWQSITEGDITLYWYYGDASFAQELMLTCQQALARLASDTGAHLEKPVRVYIYASAEALRGAMVFPQEWAGGVAYTGYGAIAIGINQTNIDWGKRAIVHELTHLVTHQMTSNPYNSIPIWLNEGLSMYAEGEMEAIYDAYLRQAVAQDTLISVRSLSSPFSAYSEQSYLSYAQSLSLVEFLINSYGQDRMFELLGTFKQGSSYDAAFESVYGFDMDELNTLWREYITEKYQTDGSSVSLIEQDEIFAELEAILILKEGLVT